MPSRQSLLYKERRVLRPSSASAGGGAGALVVPGFVHFNNETTGETPTNVVLPLPDRAPITVAVHAPADLSGGDPENGGFTKALKATSTGTNYDSVYFEVELSEVRSASSGVFRVETLQRTYPSVGDTCISLHRIHTAPSFYPSATSSSLGMRVFGSSGFNWGMAGWHNSVGTWAQIGSNQSLSPETGAQKWHLLQSEFNFTAGTMKTRYVHYSDLTSPQGWKTYSMAVADIHEFSWVQAYHLGDNGVGGKDQYISYLWCGTGSDAFPNGVLS